MNNLAESYRAAGKLDKALPLIEEVYKVSKTKLGPDHADTLASRNNLAIAYHDAGQLDKALPLYEETHMLTKARLGPDHPNTLGSMHSLAVGYHEAGQLDKALPIYEETMRLRKAKFGRDHPSTLQTMLSLAIAYDDAGQMNKALPLIEEASKLCKAKLGPNHPESRYAEQALMYTRRLLDCNDRYQRALAASGPKHLGTLLALRDLAQMNIVTGRLDHAEAQLAEVLDGLANLTPDDAIRAFAVRLVRHCLTLRQKKEPDAWTTFNAKSLLGGALLGQKKYAEAEPLLRAGYEGLKSHADTIPAEVRAARLREALQRLVTLCEATDRKDEAARWRKERDAIKAGQSGTKH
jgi:tetratricopeptide (TPR) repeat protein